MSEKQSKPIQDNYPPQGLSLSDLADWWRNQGANMKKVETLSDFERICPKCNDIQPCTGTNACTSCGGSLAKAKRRNIGLFESQ